jgi:flagellar biosynthesis regulator FlaF
MIPEEIPPENLSAVEQDAFSLAQAAIFLANAKIGDAGIARDGAKLVNALNHNLEIWIAIRTLAQSEECSLPSAVRGNLLQLSNFVAQTTFTQGVAISDSEIDTLVNINLQLSEGLLEGRPVKRMEH